MKEVKKEIERHLKKYEIPDISYILSNVKNTTSNQLLVLSIFFYSKDGEPDANTIFNCVHNLEQILKHNFDWCHIDKAIGRNHIVLNLCS